MFCPCTQSFRYIDDVLSLHNSRFGNYLHRIYPNELEVKDSTDTQMSASSLDLHLKIDNGERFKTKLYDKHDDFTFPIVNFPFIGSNITASSVYGVCISQLIRYFRADTQYSDILERSSAADAKSTQARLRCFYVEVIATKIIWSSSQSS